MIMRDHLAYDRTLLAVERTMLAYLRTVIALLAGGVTIITVFDSTMALVGGVTLIVLGFALGIFALYRYRNLRRHLKLSEALD